MSWWDWIPKNWGDWAAVVQILQFVVVIAALIYARGQFDEAARARKLQATRVLLDEIGKEDMRQLRTWILHEASPDELSGDKGFDDEAFEKARRIAVAYDRVGYMVQQNLVPEEAFFIFQQDEIAQIWKKVGNVVEYMRDPGNRPNYCKSFQYLAEDWFPPMREKEKTTAQSSAERM